ncbi:MAG: Holliday junction resolvase RuvX [Deltaproteobacteria bacterium]|nr:MAG: Holliday junction resolvase RuvX [Deltaproteobacteria bacterium]
MAKKPSRILCLDLGSRRVGVALSDPTGTIAQPHAVLPAEDEEALLEKISSIIDEYGVGKVVVGLPLKLSGSEGESARKARDFIERVRKRFPGLVVTEWDERLSTRLAEREMLRDNVKRRKRREVIDKIAAAVILQSYLDSPGRDEG